MHKRRLLLANGGQLCIYGTPKAVWPNYGAARTPEEVSRLSKLKKADIANEAERLVVDTGWMPAMFGAGELGDSAESEETPESAVEETAEHADEEEAEALAA